MLEFQEKRRVRRFLYSKVTVFLLFLLILFVLNAVWKIYKKQDLSKDNLAKTAATYQGLQARERMLSSEIERLKTVEGTEVEIREKYGLVKPDEEVIVVVDGAGGENLGATSTPATFWQKVKDWLQ